MDIFILFDSRHKHTLHITYVYMIMMGGGEGDVNTSLNPASSPNSHRLGKKRVTSATYRYC